MHDDMEMILACYFRISSLVSNYLTICEILLYIMLIETCLGLTLECHYKRQGEDIRQCTDKSILPI